jgi:hypothetical protein
MQQAQWQLLINHQPAYLRSSHRSFYWWNILNCGNSELFLCYEMWFWGYIIIFIYGWTSASNYGRAIGNGLTFLPWTLSKQLEKQAHVFSFIRQQPSHKIHKRQKTNTTSLVITLVSPWRHLLDPSKGKGNQAEPNSLVELKRQKLDFGETKASVICWM